MRLCRSYRSRIACVCVLEAGSSLSSFQLPFCLRSFHQTLHAAYLSFVCNLTFVFDFESFILQELCDAKAFSGAYATFHQSKQFKQTQKKTKSTIIINAAECSSSSEKFAHNNRNLKQKPKNYKLYLVKYAMFSNSHSIRIHSDESLMESWIMHCHVQFRQ